MTRPDTNSSRRKVVKIRPSWELAAEDDSGNWFFEFTDEPKNYKPSQIREQAAKKVMRELEGKQRL